MSAFPILLAEVADKEPPFWFFYATIAVCVVVALPMLKSKWVAVIALPLALISTLFSVAFIVAEVGDPFVGPAIIRELGRGYVASAYGAAIVPIVIVGTLLLARKKTPNSESSASRSP